MKISYYIPKTNIGYRIFIDKEIASARNIKDKKTMNSTLFGLYKIKNNLCDGNAFFWDDSDELYIIPYKGKVSKYICGKQFDFEPLQLDKKTRYLLVILDTKEVIIGILNGKQIIPLFKDESGIASKHNEGGQSAQRFERVREGQKKEWFKKIGQRVWEIWNKEVKK